jgi:hypothetical protein
VSAQLHSDVFAKSGAHEVPDGAATQIVWDAAWTSGGRARCSPRLRERLDRPGLNWTTAPLRHQPEEHEGGDVPLALQPFALHVLRLQQPPQVRGHRKRPGLSVLRLAGEQPDLACTEIDLPPFQWKNLGVQAPSGDERELHNGSNRDGEVGENRIYLGPVEETRPRRSLAQQADVRPFRCSG